MGVRPKTRHTIYVHRYTTKRRQQKDQRLALSMRCPSCAEHISGSQMAIGKCNWIANISRGEYIHGLAGPMGRVLTTEQIRGNMNVIEQREREHELRKQLCHALLFDVALSGLA